VTLLQAPPASVSQAPGQPFRPGSAVSVGLSSGALSIGAIGTVAYVDAEKVWAFGHAFDGTGRRSLLLQDAYVATVINNPVQLPDAGGSYKLAGALNDVGTVSNDGFSAVAGRVGALPPTIPVHVIARDADTARQTATNVKVADETDLSSPSGASAISFVGPLAVTQAAVIMGATPARVAGEGCLRITLKERKEPVRICNRYVSDGASGTTDAALINIVALGAGNDAASALSLIDAYKPAALHLTEVSARVTMTRGQHQAYMRRLILPRLVRRGSRVTARLVVQRVRGARETIRFKMRIPATLRRGFQRITLKGADPDGAQDLFGGLTITLGDESEPDTQGPKTLAALVKEIRKLQRWDGVRMTGRSGGRVYRDADLRIGGRASTFVRVLRG
ncbi:MAG: hypothetical protein QOI64_860, partial [Solirubrobacteraceae bacterium]|nr:hypothetical protein [Solirubrobacteraceae bacterium]